MVERMAWTGDRTVYPPVHAMFRQANCNFSFAGLGDAARRKAREEYKLKGNKHFLTFVMLDYCLFHTITTDNAGCLRISFQF